MNKDQRINTAGSAREIIPMPQMVAAAVRIALEGLIEWKPAYFSEESIFSGFFDDMIALLRIISNGAEKDILSGQIVVLVEKYQTMLETAKGENDKFGRIENALSEIRGMIQGQTAVENVVAQSSAAGQTGGGKTDKQAIEGAIKLHLSQINEVASRQDICEEELEEIEASLASLGEKAPFLKGAEKTKCDQDISDLERRKTSVSREAKKLASLYSETDGKVRVLSEYLAAVEKIERGLDQNLLEIAEFKLESEPVSEEPEISVVSPAALGDTPMSTVDHVTLEKLGRPFDLLAGDVFVLSLYEIAGREKKRLRGSIVSKAKNVGLLRRFGWENTSDVLREFSPKESDNTDFRHSLMAFRGTIGGDSLYLRTSRVLPWKLNEVFSESEVQALKDKLAKQDKKIIEAE